MQIIRDTSAITPEPCVATIGFFDGVHAGHRYLIQQVKEIAAAKGLRSALVTFPVHPRKVMNVEYHPELLTTPEEKISLLADIGVKLRYYYYGCYSNQTRWRCALSVALPSVLRVPRETRTK